MGAERMLDKTLNQTLKLEAAKAAHGKGWSTFWITITRVHEQKDWAVHTLRVWRESVDSRTPSMRFTGS
jgi:hypothetical protein